MEFNPDLPGFDDFLYWHSQRTGSHNFDWDDPNHRNAYLAWEQRMGGKLSGAEETPPQAPRVMMIASQTPISLRAFRLPRGSDDSRDPIVQIHPHYDNPGQVASDPRRQEEDLSSPQRQSEGLSQQQPPSESQEAQSARKVASDVARKTKAYEKEWTVLNKAHSKEISDFDKKQQTKVNTQHPGEEQLRAREALLQQHRDEHTSLKENMEPNSVASVKAYKAAGRALDKSHNEKIGQFDKKHGFFIYTWADRPSWKPEQVMVREALQQKHRAENEILKEKHGVSNDSLSNEAGEKGSIKHATKGVGTKWLKTEWQSLRDRYGIGGQEFQDEVRAADDLLPHFKKMWMDTLEIHIKAAHELNSGISNKLTHLPRGSTVSESIKREGKASRIAMYEKQKESRKWIFEACAKGVGRVAAAQPGPEVEMEPPKLVVAMDYYNGAAEEQAAAYDQYNPDTIETDTESQAEDQEAATGYELQRPDVEGMENRPEYIEEKPTVHEQQETDCIGVETEEHSVENWHLISQQKATSDDTIPLNSTLVVDPGKPTSKKSPGVPKVPSEDALVEILPSDLNRRLKELEDIQAKELRDFDEPFFVMMRNAEGDPSERARASIQWNTIRAEILEMHKQALEIVQASQIDKDKLSTEKQRGRAGLDETVRPEKSVGQQIISQRGPNNNAYVLAEDPTGTSGPDEKLWNRKAELQAIIDFNGGIDISNMVRDDEPPYPRCSRCLNLKKGCDRQRPCRRCLDDGVPAHCATRDTDMDKKPRKNKGPQSPKQPPQNQPTENILLPTTTPPNIKVKQGSDENMDHLPVFQEAANQTYGPNPTQGQYVKFEQTTERSCLYEQVNGRRLEAHSLKKLEDIIQGQKQTDEHQQGIPDAVRKVSKALIDSPLVYRYAEGLVHVPSAGSTTSLARRTHLSPDTTIELENLDTIQLCEKTVFLDVHMQIIAKANSREERKLAEDNASIALFELGEAHKIQQLNKISKNANVTTKNEQVSAVLGEGSWPSGVEQRPSATSMKDPPPENNLLPNYSVRPKEKADTVPTNALPPICKKGAEDIKEQAITESAAINLFPEEFHEELRLLEKVQIREMNNLKGRGLRSFLSPGVATKIFAKEKKQQLIDNMLVEHVKAKHEFVQNALKKKRPRSEGSSPVPNSKFPRLKGEELQPIGEPTDLSSSMSTNAATTGQKNETSQNSQADAEQHCIDSLAEECRKSMDSLMKSQAYELAIIRKFHGERCDKAYKEPDKKALLLKKREEALISLQDKHIKQREELTKEPNEKKRARSKSPSPTRPVKIPRVTRECQLVEEPSGRPLGLSRSTKTRQMRSGSMTAKHGSESEVGTRPREELQEGVKQGHMSNKPHMVGRDRTLLKQEAQKGNEVSTREIQHLQGQLNGQPDQLPIIQPTVENISSRIQSPECAEDEPRIWTPEPLGREAALVRAAQYDLARVDWTQAVEDSSADVMDDSKWIGDDLLSVLEIDTSKLGFGGEVL
jgi:hypothetical protein